MTDVYERYYVDLEYGEEYRGVYLVRGENVVLVGELVKQKGSARFSIFNNLIMYYFIISLSFPLLGWGRIPSHFKENGKI